MERYEVPLQPWQLLLLISAGWINQREQDVIEYLRGENSALREKLGERRILLDNDQRRCLAVKGRILGGKMLEQVAAIMTPDTILRWRCKVGLRHAPQEEMSFAAATYNVGIK